MKNSVLGDINEKQQNALSSMSRNLDYLSDTVKNFLSLSRIEKNEFILNKTDILLKKDIFDGAVETFNAQIKEKGI